MEIDLVSISSSDDEEEVVPKFATRSVPSLPQQLEAAKRENDRLRERIEELMMTQPKQTFTMDPVVEEFMNKMSAAYAKAGRPEPTFRDVIRNYNEMTERLKEREKEFADREQELMLQIQAQREKILKLAKPKSKPKPTTTGSAKQEKLSKKIAEEKKKIAEYTESKNKSNDLEYIEDLKKEIQNAKVRLRNAEKKLEQLPRVAGLGTCVMCDNIAYFSTDLYYCSSNCMNEHCSK